MGKVFVAQGSVTQDKLILHHTERTSTAHRYARMDWSEDQNLKVYGEDYSADGLGHNFEVEGRIHSNEIQLSGFQQTVWQVSRSIDHKFLSEGPSTLEWITQNLWKDLQTCYPKDKVEITVREGPGLWASFDGVEMKLKMRTVIQCVHRHFNPDLNAAENLNLYGKCSGYHGHEYKVDVTIAGQVDAASQLLIERAKFKNILKDHVSYLNGTELNLHLGNTSGEKIAMHFFNILNAKFFPLQLYEVAVHETRKNSFFVRA